MSTSMPRRPAFARARLRLRVPAAFAALILLAGCDHRVASEKAIDVCALALQPVTTMLQETPTPAGDMRPPSAGYCEFTTEGDGKRSRRISVRVMTQASMEPDDLARTAKIMLAEAAQTWGEAGGNEFAEVAKLAATFGGGSGNARRQVVIGERGVLMEVGIDDGGFSPDQVAALITGLWERVLDYEAPAQ